MSVTFHRSSTTGSRRATCAIIVCALVVPLWSQTDGQLPDARFYSELPPAEFADELFARLNTEQRLAQLFLVGWPGTEPSGTLLEWIDRRGIGGVKIFGWNANDATALAASIRTMQQRSLDSPAGIPLFTATDQEGGWVRHVRDRTSLTPGNMALGAAGVPEATFSSARRIAGELRSLGINLNFAPTVDIYRNPDAAVIGARAFGDDPLQSAMLGMAFFRGMNSERVIATAKHFPGHGNASGDSHIVLPRLTEGLSEIWDVDLVPFRMLIREGVPAILSAHLAFPTITGSDIPASLSEYFMREVLRERLGFEGIVVTDDLYMLGATTYAIRNGWSFARMVVEAIAAGNDMVMLSQTPAPDGAIWQELLRRYETDASFRETTDESVLRVLRIKAEYLGTEDRVPLAPDPAAVAGSLPGEGNPVFFAEQAALGTSILRSETLPVSPDELGSVLLAGNVGNFFGVGTGYFSGAARYRFPYSPSDRSREADRSWMQHNGGRFDTIIFGLSNRNSFEVLAELEQHADRVIVLSTLSPLYLAHLPWVRDAVAVYGMDRQSLSAGFEAIIGGFSPSGQVPLRELRNESPRNGQ